MSPNPMKNFKLEMLKTFPIFRQHQKEKDAYFLTKQNV